jgi:peptidoglycan/xylan/chitin deacetylase (PgdA/CDA1 family)
MRVPILAYHSLNVHGRDYGNNDHVAFRDDLAMLCNTGWHIAPLFDVVSSYLGMSPALPAKSIAITFDDGSDFDFHDLAHPEWGVQRSMFNIMCDQISSSESATKPHATSFVIVSPSAREQMDKTCILGKGWWRESWWNDAVGSGLMSIANHSWDHNHDCVTPVAVRAQTKGNFRCVESVEDADAEIRVAAEYLNRAVPNPGTQFFAYPYGETSDYLRQEYLPAQAANPFVLAAFGTQGGVVTEANNRWHLPRYVCGFHWKSPEAFAELLRDAT